MGDTMRCSIGLSARQCGTNSNGANVHNSVSKAFKLASSPVTTTWAPEATALRNKRQAYASLSGALK